LEEEEIAGLWRGTIARKGAKKDKEIVFFVFLCVFAPLRELVLFLRHRVASLLPADALEVAFGTVLVSARDALHVDCVRGILSGLLDFAVD
jgi:hypothetical protein